MRLRALTYALPLAMVTSPAVAESMPQLDPTWFGNQLFWLVVSFTLLYLLVSMVILPGVTGVIGTRKGTISSLIAEAEAMKDQAHAAREHYEKVESNARKDAAAMVAEVTGNMNRSIAESQAKMDADMKKRIAASDAAIAEKLQRANDAVAPAAASLAADIYVSLLGNEIDAKQFEQAISKR